MGRWQFRQSLLREVAAFEPHVIVAYDQGAAWATLELLRSERSKVVLHIHDNANRHDQSWYSVRAMQWRAVMRASDRFDARVVPELERAHDLWTSWQARGDFQVVANAPLRRINRRNSLLRLKLGIPQEAPIAVSIGNIGLLTDVTTALTFTRLKWHFVSIGEADQRALAAARTRASELGISARVHILPYASYDSVCEWLHGCDVGLALYPKTNTSINWRSAGTASVKLMEYMAAGLPTVTTQQKSLLRLNDDINALHFLTAETPQAVASALDQLEPNSERWRRVAAAARSAHETRFNMEAQLAPLIRGLGMAESSRPITDSFES
jgi:glycosyltransferase involved in cell wall biosynthesis